MRRSLTVIALLCLTALTLAAARKEFAILPNGWRLQPASGALAITQPMPQGIALSPSGDLLAVVEAGNKQPQLRILQTPGLRTLETIELPGGFGRPVWADAHDVFVAGAESESILRVDLRSKRITRTAAGKKSWPAAIARSKTGLLASANDGNASVWLDGHSIHVGAHPADVVFSRDGTRLYASLRESSSIAVIDVARKQVRRTIPVGLHPGALALNADGDRLYVAESDDDAVGVIDTRTNRRTADISVRLRAQRANAYGASPNALAIRGDEVFVSLGGQNAIAVIRGDRVVARIPVGWYPTSVAVAQDGTCYVSNGKGEGMHPNPRFDYRIGFRSPSYVATLMRGSVREVSGRTWPSPAVAQLFPEWTPAPEGATILRANGPIKHVIYIIKENRSYDQILGDIPQANGDPALAVFGQRITPNQHALARRFGIFDNAYTDAQVSADGHNWTDAAFANDYVERFWPVNYGPVHGRPLYDFQDGSAPDVPHNGYLWDAALRAHVSFRDYGEDDQRIGTFKGLRGHYDPHYVGWNLKYSDLDRYREWDREFKAFVARRDLPQFEIVWLPNDHTAYGKVGMLTQRAYVATNDWMTGKFVQAISHSPFWKSTAVFILEDDAQDGADHVSDQRSTFYLASPYAKGGLQHGHYSTVSFIRTIELLLGLPPLSIYDQTAQPLYDAFARTPVNAAPFTAVRPDVDLDERNKPGNPGANVSEHIDLSRPDQPVGSR